jgi:GT2 family glycosyltransferase
MRSLAVQVVVYDVDLGSMRRLAAALGATARKLREHHGLERIVWRLGDCSRWPCLPDGAAEILRETAADAAGGQPFDDVTITFFDDNLGSGGGSNALAGLGDEALIWVLNPDTYPAPDAAVRLLDALGADETVAVAESRQIPIEHQKHYDPVTGATSWGSGFSLLIRRQAFDAVGGFDDHFFPLYCDDVDLSWRLRHGGWTVVHVPRSVVFHDKRIDTDGGVRWTPTAARSSMLARLWLYRRYGRPDLEASFLDELERSDASVAIAVLEEFRRRVAVDDVPVELDGAARVATFVEGQFAPRRFSYVG